MRIGILSAVGWLLLEHFAHAQGAFTNLDFESAQVPAGSKYKASLSASVAFPGWTVGAQGMFVPPTTVSYDFVSDARFGGISLWDSNPNHFPLMRNDSELDGTYSAELCGGPPFGGTAAVISQTGVVPIGTKTLQVDIQDYGDPFLVNLGGQNLTMVPMQVFTKYTLYGADISSFAGKIETLSFTSPSEVFVGGGEQLLVIDDIVFSPSAIPEPCSLGLLVSGTCLLTYSRKLLSPRKKAGHRQVLRHHSFDGNRNSCGGGA